MKTIRYSPMRALVTVLLFCLAASTRAAEWKNEIFHCAANIPESPGWQIIDAPPAPGIAPVLTMQNMAKQSVFGISVVEKYRDAKISDVAVQKELEALLRQFGYQFIGHASVRTGGIDWLQYPVSAGAGAQAVSGIIRYGSAGGYIFGITMLRGGGQQAAQDVELQQAAASFRLLPATPPPAPVPIASAIPAAASRDSAASKTAQPAKPAAASGATTATAEPPPEDNSTAKLVWGGVAGLVVLIIFASIITRNPAAKR